MKSATMRPIKIEFKVDDSNGIVSLTNSDYFTAYRISTSNTVSKLVVSKKSPYRDVFGRNGVYILVEDDCKNPPRFYVGKARPFSKRFVPHCSSAQSFKQSHLHWTDGIFIVGENAKFSKWGSDEVEWFEHRLLKAIITAGNYKVTNNPSATFAGGSVDEILCEKQLSDIKVIIGLLGYPKLFGEPNKSSTPTTIPQILNLRAKNPRRTSNQFKGMSATVVRALMKHLFTSGLITVSDIKSFIAPSSHLAYKIGSSSAVTMMTDYVNHARKYGGQLRYYSDKYSFKGRLYALSSQLYPRSIPSFLKMALRHGLSENDVAKLCGSKTNVALKFFAEIKNGNLK